MSNYCNFTSLKHDLEKNKQIVLFVGAGINATSDQNIDMSWDAIIGNLFNDALRYLAIEKDIPASELEIIRKGLDKKSLNSDDFHFKDLFKICNNLDYEFPPLIKASIIKEVLGDNYISAIQNFLYSQCNKRLINKKFKEAYYLENRKECRDKHPFYTLYTLARLIILYPYIKAVVSYNYDNFLKVAISILWEDKEKYFTQEELDRIGDRKFVIQDISGFMYN